MLLSPQLVAMVKTRGGASTKVPSTPARRKSKGTSRSVATTPGSVVSEGRARAERGVPLFVRKQLARDIQNKGGINEFDRHEPQGLDKLLNNPDRKEYGGRGDPLRKKIANLVTNQWKTWPTEKYYTRVVIPYVIQDNQEYEGTASAAPTTSKKKSSSSKTRSTSPDSSIDSDSQQQTFRDHSTPFDSIPSEIATVINKSSSKKKAASPTPKMAATTMHGGILTRKLLILLFVVCHGVDANKKYIRN